ncbi:hypothetical protein BDV97DRAFT_403310 [Delphinella strobiligena]|nr:hypothetical protein BDV97DRAFT_403310 [Delphinella strobiligena]
MLKTGHFKKDFALLVFLVTPAYASNARHDTDLFEQTIQRIYPRAADPDRYSLNIHSLVAVVDKLPQPSASIHHLAVKDAGSEGLAFMFTDDPADAPGISVEEAEDISKSIRDVASSLQVRRSLTFDILTERTYHGKSEGEDSSSGSSSRSYSVQVPLANTIFHNGLPTTMIHTRHKKEQGEPHQIVSSRYLNNQTLRLPFFAANEQGSNLTLTAPLVPLTEARSVVACMGNIVRRLASGPHDPSKTSDDNTILASHELEESVQAYFSAREIPPQTVSVWALVIPKEAFSIYSTSMVDILHPQNLKQRWKDNALNWIESAAHTPLSLLQHHARLHKVLSGGGGWGKKAGLLSLDPDFSYLSEESGMPALPFFADNDPEVEQESALRNIVSPGDYIQFYMAPTSSADEQIPLYTVPERNLKQQSAEFGIIPSTVDSMPLATEKEINDGKGFKLYQAHFGALSEVGIALTIHKHDLNNRQHVEQLNQTKIDVPFGRFTLLSSEEGETTSSSELGGQSTNLESLWEQFGDSEKSPHNEEDNVASLRSDKAPSADPHDPSEKKLSKLSWAKQKLIRRWILQQLGLEGVSPPLSFHQTLLRFDEAKDKLGDNIVLSEHLKAALIRARAIEQASVDNGNARTEQTVKRHEHARKSEPIEQASVDNDNARTKQTVERQEHATKKKLSELIEQALVDNGNARTKQTVDMLQQDTRTSSQETRLQRPMTIRKIEQAKDDPEAVAYARKTWVKEDIIAWFAKKSNESGRLERLQAQQTYRDEVAASEQAWTRLQEELAAVPGDEASKKAEKDEQATKQAPEVADGVRKLFGL